MLSSLSLALSSGVTTDPADPAMRGVRAYGGPTLFNTAIFVRACAAMSRLK